MNGILPESSLNGRRVLIVEDEYFIAVLLERSLQDQGAKLVTSLGRLSDALEFARSDGFAADVALVDINLDGEMSFSLIDQLISRSVPVILLSGYDKHLLPERFSGLPQLQKPASMPQVIAAVRDAVSISSNRDE
ncbi:response regulator [Sphingomonas lacusdianchii]|uniref:response regulator n=1 Tax=Sphingomonas lacusdianchii TaxID=2917992 RepID=UPI001F5AF95E|nr:response regulator [Sphingomonas sp. JXJ CY 53]